MEKILDMGVMTHIALDAAPADFVDQMARRVLDQKSAAKQDVDTLRGSAQADQYLTALEGVPVNDLGDLIGHVLRFAVASERAPKGGDDVVIGNVAALNC